MWQEKGLVDIDVSSPLSVVRIAPPPPPLARRLQMPSKGKGRRRRAANAVDSSQGLLKKGKVRFGRSAP